MRRQFPLPAEGHFRIRSSPPPLPAITAALEAPDVAYSLACHFVRRGERSGIPPVLLLNEDPGALSLRRLLAAAFTDRDLAWWALRDPELRYISETPSFRRLIGDIAAPAPVDGAEDLIKDAPDLLDGFAVAAANFLVAELFARPDEPPTASVEPDTATVEPKKNGKKNGKKSGKNSGKKKSGKKNGPKKEGGSKKAPDEPPAVVAPTATPDESKKALLELKRLKGGFAWIKLERSLWKHLVVEYGATFGLDRVQTWLKAMIGEVTEKKPGKAPGATSDPAPAPEGTAEDEAKS